MPIVFAPPTKDDAVVSMVSIGPGQVMIVTALGRLFKYEYDAATGGVKQRELPVLGAESKKDDRF